jgi:hypothetical protein
MEALIANTIIHLLEHEFQIVGPEVEQYIILQLQGVTGHLDMYFQRKLSGGK